MLHMQIYLVNECYRMLKMNNYVAHSISMNTNTIEYYVDWDLIVCVFTLEELLNSKV